jgi:DedD protein
MEQKKILLVTISVGVFLVIVIGAAIMILGTGNSYPNITSGGIISAGSSLPGYTTPGSSYSDLSYTSQPEPYSGNVDVVQSNENTVPESAETNSLPANVPAINVTDDPGPSTVISVNRPSTAAVPDAAPSSRPTAETTPARSSSSSSTSTQSAATSSSTSTVAASASTSKSYPDFWVQTGSFSTLARAEGVKETLSSKGITSIIENRTINGTLYYRVRVGPYTSKNEADHWLALIKSINGFEESQVWQSQ